MNDPSPWWDRDVYADRRPFLLARGRILSALREWFRRRGFLEVETPALQVSPGNEIHLHAFATELVTPARRAHAALPAHLAGVHLQEAAGRGRGRGSSAFARVFRNRERGPLHHPEFTMLEWYRANEPYEALMEDCAAILVEAAKAAGCLQLQWQGPHRRSLCGARAARPSPTHSTKFAGIDLLATLQGREPTATALAARRARPATSRSPTTTPGPTCSAACWSNASSRSSASAAPTLLDRYPLPEAALARARQSIRGWRSASSSMPAASSSPTALASSTDAGRAAAPLRGRDGGASSAAMASAIRSTTIFSTRSHTMPPASGIALGFDRLVMLATGATRIEQVLWAPVAGDDR